MIPTDLFNLILNTVDIGFIVACNILTYIIIKAIDYLNKDKVVPTIAKRIILICSIVIVASLYYATNYINTQVLINSAIAAPVAWDWCLKYIVVKLGIDYKKIDNVIT